jgi:hypothetical protein
MALHMTGLGVADYQEIVESLLIAADHAGGPELASYRVELADRIGAGLETLPAPREVLETLRAVNGQ